MSTPRYAVYFSPEVDSAWWRFGAGWLGRDERRGQPLPQPRVPGFSAEEFHALTSEPRRYGFHATLKAPFRLRDGVTEDQLRTRFAALARRLRALSPGPLAPRLLDDFVALVPVGHHAGVDALATACVLDLDDLRAPPTAQEIARRRPERLDLQQRELLRRYGYPYVLAQFRFHLTLTGTVDPVTADLLVHRAAEAVAALQATAPLQLDRLCLFREEHAGASFLRVQEEVFEP